MVKRITYRLTAGENILLLRQHDGSVNMPKANLKRMKERYAEKWGVKPEAIKVTREVTEE